MAEDVAQEAFLKAWTALPRFRAGSPLRPWLLRIVANEARNLQKAAGRRWRLVQRLHDARWDGSNPSPEVLVVATEQRETLLRAVNALAPMDRLVISCRYFLDLSEEETAAVLNCPRGTVKSRLSRALARLRHTLSVSAVGTAGVEGAVHE